VGKAHFERTDFLGAAFKLALEQGPVAVTVGSVTQELGAPIGSFYHRFASRDALLGELWLETVMSFQVGFVAAINAGDGLAAALHTPRWARNNLGSARFLLLYDRDNFVRGDWPDVLRERAQSQAREIEKCVRTFARDQFSNTNSVQIRRAIFILVEVPLAAVRPHLRRGERPPAVVDELIRATYKAVVETPNANWSEKKQPRTDD